MTDSGGTSREARTVRPAVITVFNRKGGVGKTTTSVNLAVCLAAMGKRVALVDFDAQGNATTSLGFTTPPTRGSHEIMLGSAQLADVLRPTVFPGLGACCASEDMAGAEIALALTLDPQMRFAKAVEQQKDLDFIVVDCPPALGLLPVNALAAADAVILPVTPEPMAHDGLFRAWQDIRHIRATLNPHIGMVGLVLTMTDDDSVHEGLTRIIRREFGHRVLPLTIPRDHAVIEASARDLPVAVHAPDSPSSRAYLALAGVIAADGWRSRRAAIDQEPFALVPAEDDSLPPAAHADQGKALETLRAWKTERDAETPPADLSAGPEPEPAWNEQLDEAAPPWMRTLRRAAAWALFFLAGFGVGLLVGLGRDSALPFLNG